MTTPGTNTLRQHAREIWQAGVDAVDSQVLVQNAITLSATALTISGHEILLADLGRLVVVGAGKAGAGMAAAVESVVGEDLLQDRVSGWVNVPADCVRDLQQIHLHPARPAGVNEPTEAGVFGAEKILDAVNELNSRDVCLVLLSGGGSALLPAPATGISLADKQAVTRILMHSGASIGELNTVRKQLSRIKGGRLSQATKAGLVISLIISDVIGDPLDVIASGPTVPDSATPQDALLVLDKIDPKRKKVPTSVWEHLEQQSSQAVRETAMQPKVHNHIIGNNAVAMSAASCKAKELGYHVESLGSNNADEARAVGRGLAQTVERLQADDISPKPTCVLSGGEPIVNLVETDQPRKGGRNQEVALSALVENWDDDWSNVVLVSGGTDGEDGPTDAAGAFADQDVRDAATRMNLDPASFLAINNSYPFFEQTGGHLKTGPTHTNVMDLRVLLVGND